VSAVPELHCPLCGARFPATAGCASGCPLAGSCRTVCCPHCHYRFVTAASSTVAGWLERLLKGARS
jgi:hypothetical protein